MRTTTWVIALTALGAVFGQVTHAQENLYGSYLVPDDRTTNKDEHKSAEFMAFRSTQRSYPESGLLFLQKTGKYKHQVFVCQDATYDRTKESLSCSQLAPDRGRAVKETLTIGGLGGSFCKGLGGKYKEGKPIMEPGDCKVAKCACYELIHQCWDGKEYTIPCEDQEAEVGTTLVPPGRGAGSGGSH